MLLGCIVLTTSDAIMKWLTGDYPVSQLLCARGSLLLIVLLPFLVLKRGRNLAMPIVNVRGHLIRGALSTVSAFLFLNGLRFLPLAEAVTLTFAGPLFLTAMAPYLLSEKVGWRRWLAVMIGFAGVVLVFRPGTAVLQWVALLPLGAALAEAFRDALTRQLRYTETALAMMTTSTAIIVAVSVFSMGFGWQSIGLRDLFLIAVTALLFGVAHFAMIEALRQAEAVLVSPFRYSAVLWATVLGIMYWDHMPDTWVIVGAVLIVGSGLYIFYRETVRLRDKSSLME